MRFDYLIVGSGLAGAVLAERLASQAGKKVLIVERRNHIGGNCFDYYDDAGVLVHKYGPHYFRTNDKSVWDYLSQFTDWHYVQYRIMACVDGQYLPLPLNLDTYNRLYGASLSSFDLQNIFLQHDRPPETFTNSEDAIVAKVGRELFDKFYKNYTKKQWDLWPAELDASVCGRIPIRVNRDDRYFTDKYQAMPKHGYHRMFERMLDHPKIHIMLQTDFRDIRQSVSCDTLVYTGPIDEFFECKFGRLPYRSLSFEYETHHTEFYQQASQVNYPNDYDFTRVVEIKHATGQKHPATTIVREYPSGNGDPYYPIPTQANRDLYEQYRREAEKTGVIFLGRLAEYTYLNMDQVVRQSLDRFEEMGKRI